MAVTAKFKVTRVTKFDWPGQDVREVEMTPDYGEGKNAEWAAATPSGVIRMTIGNPAALEQLPEGTSLTVTFVAEE